MKKALSLVTMAGLGLGLGLILTGCDNDTSYSSDVKYGFRTDPVLMGQANSLGGERWEPDRPGQLPLLAMKDLDEPQNPLHPDRKKIVDAEVLRDPSMIPAATRDQLDKALVELFGTPAKPIVRKWDEDKKQAVELSSEEQAALKLDDATLAKGSQHYRVHCVHCHGVPGDGRGPTARWVNPHPRDFRAGLFKFQSVDQANAGTNLPPHRLDLLRTIEYGLEGSAMPAFTLLSQAEREALASYVIHLSLRGNAELTAIKEGFDYDKAKGTLTEKKEEGSTPLDNLRGIQTANLGLWLRSQGARIQVPAYPQEYTTDRKALAASIERGKQLFTAQVNKENEGNAKFVAAAKAAACVTCHKDYGRQAQFRWDEWATLVRPNNFTQGVFRGGRRPEDIYFRIHSGINGSGMARFGTVIPADNIWDLVNFVRSVSYPQMLEQAQVKLD